MSRQNIFRSGARWIALVSVIAPAVCLAAVKAAPRPAPKPAVKPVASAAEGPLKWADLVDHPERWPTSARVLMQLNFGGDVLKAGTPVRVVQVGAKDATLLAPQGFTFKASPKDSDLLAAANAAWIILSPAQQALTPQAIAADPSLWPGKAVVTDTLTFGPVKINAGDTLPVLRVDATEASFYKPGQKNVQIVPLTSTDIFRRSRSLLKLPYEERPGRMSEVFDGLTIDANQKPLPPHPATYYVLYYAASTCPRCAVFTPKMLDHYTQVLAQRTDVSFITTGTDATLPAYLAYVQKTGMPWPILPQANYGVIGAIDMPKSVEIPGIIVFDRFGRVLLSTATMTGQPLTNAETALNKLDLVIQPAAGKTLEAAK